MSMDNAMVALLFLIHILRVSMVSVVTCVDILSVVSNISVMIGRVFSFSSEICTYSILVIIVTINVENYSVSMNVEDRECKS